MKKSILGLALTLTSALSFACHIDPIGYCKETGKSYFITRVFNPNSFYEFRVTGTTDVILTFTTGNIVADSIISLGIEPGVGVEFRYKWTDKSYWTSDWDNQVYSTSNTYAGCGALPVRISNFYVQKRNNSTVISFDAGNETDIKLYNIKASVDGKDWVQIGSIKATGARHYSIPISAGLVASFIPLMLLFVNKKKWAVLASIALVIVFYSCKKEAIEKQNKDYKFFQIESVDNSGVNILSEIKTL